MSNRRKMINTAAISSERLAGVEHFVERLYWRIYMATDKYGVMAAKPWDVWQKAAPGVTGFDKEVVQKALDILEHLGLIIVAEIDGVLWLEITDHDRFQSADFLRKRGERRSPKVKEYAQAAPKGSEGQRAVASGSEWQDPAPEAEGRQRAAKGSYKTKTKTKTINIVSKDTCPKDTFEPALIDEDSVSFKANVTDVEKPSKISNDDVLDVFEYWVEQDTRTGGTTLAKKLTNDRRQKIRARLKEGYEVEQLKQAIDYYLSQPFYLGENDRNTRYTDLTTIFRSGSKVEEGLQAAPVKSVKRTLSLEELEADVLAEFEAQRNGGVR